MAHAGSHENAHGRVYTKMSMEMPMKVEASSVLNTPQGPHEDSHESAHGNFDSAHVRVACNSLKSGRKATFYPLWTQFGKLTNAHVPAAVSLVTGTFATENRGDLRLRFNFWCSQRVVLDFRPLSEGPLRTKHTTALESVVYDNLWQIFSRPLLDFASVPQGKTKGQQLKGKIVS